MLKRVFSTLLQAQVWRVFVFLAFIATAGLHARVVAGGAGVLMVMMMTIAMAMASHGLVSPLKPAQLLAQHR